MRTHLTKKGSRLFAGAAVAVSTLAMLVGLMPVAQAQTVARTGLTTAGSASAAAPRASNCRWFPLPAQFFIGDPSALYPTVHGSYNNPGSADVAYKISGPFPHATTFSFTTYDDVMDVTGANYLLNDNQIVQNPGSVNPFVPGTRVMGTPRNYTAWAWPDSVPVPAGLKNVFLYPTKARFPGDKRADWNLVMRFYHMQPGYRAVAAMRATKMTAVSTRTMAPVPCPLGAPATSIPAQVTAVLRHFDVYGPTEQVPAPPTGNKIYFLRYPLAMMLGPEGFSTDGCTGYLMGQLPKDQISVVTVHKVAQYFNNDLVTPASIMKDYQIRYQSETIAYWPENRGISVNSDDATYTANGELVTVYLPGDPRLPASEIAQVRAMAARLHYNVIQAPRNPANRPLARLLPYPALIYRNKAISSSFKYSVNAVPCWTDPNNPATAGNNYKDFTNQTSPAFFRQFGSSPRNQGPYWIGGVKLTFAQFVSKFSK